jgi:hypothetical protein
MAMDDKFKSEQMMVDNDLYRGRIKHMADHDRTSVRVFISSTFTGEPLS